MQYSILGHDEWDRELYFPDYYFYAERRLINHTIKIVFVKSLDDCEYLCYLNDDCVSLNIKNKDPVSGTHECELNNSTHMEHDRDMMTDTVYYYRGAKNFCGKISPPCQNNATCQSGFTYKGYRCLCTPGFEGEYCEKECHNYQSLTKANRKVTSKSGNYICDKPIGPGWFRFQGDAGTKMPTKCPPTHACDTHAPGWLNGGHPTVAEGKVTRQVCFHWGDSCCKWSTNTEVRDCGSYYVYYFRDTPACSLRYCGSN
ncbi:hypothetical protein ACROYT_G030179 [Oculina patagonica]